MVNTKEDLINIVSARLSGILHGNDQEYLRSIICKDHLSGTHYRNRVGTTQQLYNTARSVLNAQPDQQSLTPWVREILFGGTRSSYVTTHVN